eukprot:TRINITY_DN9850_c0_g1_i1.p3 TRINITY_DN9850_c0_g1~~TRINITY_DN9850_c0_g1_i1.p3  ORF type:complete len:101 (+),score=23.02 TRINITY_DN9850_c0_g1_i1:187-489(+)
MGQCEVPFGELRGFSKQWFSLHGDAQAKHGKVSGEICLSLSIEVKNWKAAGRVNNYELTRDVLALVYPQGLGGVEEAATLLIIAHGANGAWARRVCTGAV